MGRDWVCFKLTGCICFNGYFRMTIVNPFSCLSLIGDGVVKLLNNEETDEEDEVEIISLSEIRQDRVLMTHRHVETDV